MGKAKRSGGGRGGQQQTEWKESEAEDTSMVPGREGGADDDVNEEIERKKQEYFKRKREEKKTATVLGGDEDTSFPAIQVKRSRLAADDGELSDVDVAGEEANPEEQAKEYHGIEIMPFNMREEQEEGHVTEAGDFVYDADKKDKDEREDGWIDDFEGRHGEEAENEMKRLRKRKEEQEKELLDKLQEEEQALSSVDVEAVVVELISFMQEGETVPRALSRVGGQQQQKRWKNTNKKNKKNEGEAEAEKEKEKEKERRKNVERMTYLIDTLSAVGMSAIYGYSYEDLLVRREQARQKKRQTGQELLPTSAGGSEEWEYKLGGDDSQVYGPFSTEQMKGWRDQGHFTAERAPTVRKVGESGPFLPFFDMDAFKA